MSEPMKGCPFCGGRAEFDDCCDGGYKVMCSNCLVESPEPAYRSFLFETKAEAIEAWNKRTDSDEITRLQSEVEGLRGRLKETSSKADALSYALVHSMTDKQMGKFHRQFCELQDCLSQNSQSAQRLRQQADEAEKAGGGDA